MRSLCGKPFRRGGRWGIIPAMRDRGGQDADHFFRGAAVIAALTLLSRVFGLVRDAAISAMGATHTMGAFRVAFAIPNLFRRLFGEGAVSAAFVPVFTEVTGAGGRAKARRVLANACGVLAVILGGLMVLGELLLAIWLVAAPGDAHRTLLLQLTMIVLPFMVTVCLLALGAAALNCRGHFAYPAFAPILLNVFMICGALLAHRFFRGDSPQGLFLLAGSVTVAGVVQLLGVIWLLRRMHLAAVWRIRPILAPVRRIARMTLPMILPIGILQFCALFDKVYADAMAVRPGADTLEIFGWRFAKPLGEGVVTWFDNANRLYQFPMALFGISLATAVFPLFSRYAAAGDLAALRDTTNRALRLSLFLGIPAGAALILLAEPAVAAIFRHGRFTTGDVERTAMILRLYCLGMWAYFCNHILLRAFFAQKDTRTPLKVSCLLALVNVTMAAALVFTPLRAGAFGLATAMTSTANSLTLLWILRRRWGRIGLRSILVCLARTAIATAVMAAGLFPAVRWLCPSIRQAGNARAAGALAVCVPLGAGLYLVVTRLTRARELTELRSALRTRESEART